MFAHATSACASSQIPRVVSHRKSSNAVAATSSSSSRSSHAENAMMLGFGGAFLRRDDFSAMVARNAVSDTNANRASGRGMLLLAKATAEVRIFASFGWAQRWGEEKEGRFRSGDFFVRALKTSFLFVSAVGLLLSNLSKLFLARPRHK